MTLSEAIQHAEEKAADNNCCCREEHAQLAKWLKELQFRRFVESQPVPMYNPFKPVYNPCDYLQFRNVNPF